jgi:hypothetical protein
MYQEFRKLLVTILALLPLLQLPIGVLLAISLMWNELNRRRKYKLFKN